MGGKEGSYFNLQYFHLHRQVEKLKKRTDVLEAKKRCLEASNQESWLQVWDESNIHKRRLQKALDKSPDVNIVPVSFASKKRLSLTEDTHETSSLFNRNKKRTRRDRKPCLEFKKL